MNAEDDKRKAVEDYESVKKDQDDLLVLLTDQDAKLKTYRDRLRELGEKVSGIDPHYNRLFLWFFTSQQNKEMYFSIGLGVIVLTSSVCVCVLPLSQPNGPMHRLAFWHGCQVEGYLGPVYRS